jgi:hypothetical protein
MAGQPLLVDVVQRHIVGSDLNVGLIEVCRYGVADLADCCRRNAREQSETMRCSAPAPTQMADGGRS